MTPGLLKHTLAVLALSLLCLSASRADPPASKRPGFDALPLDQAIKIVKGRGTRRLAIFEDPDCPYCRRLEHELAGIDDLTVYVLLFPLEQLHPGATAKSSRIWCSADRARAWAEAQRDVEPRAAPSCRHPLQRIARYARASGIKATPTLVFENGLRVPGAIDAADIEKLLQDARRR
jgi:thiol:disulfide interchange protein DsbC